MNLLAMVTLVVTTSDDGDANVRPGWIPFFITLALGAFLVFLYFSMKKQLNRINIPGDPQPDRTVVAQDDDPTRS